MVGVFTPQKDKENQQLYGLYSELGFETDPEYEPTKILIESLRIAGFETNNGTYQSPNIEFIPTADGYDIESVPGTHPVHYLEISW